MAYFISDQGFKKGKDPNIDIINEIHSITFNKGEYVGNLELPIEDMQQIPEDLGPLAAQSITIKRMMAEKVEVDTFKPPCHKLRKDIETKLEELLKEYKSQFTQDETTNGTTPLTKMTIDTRDSEPDLQKPYPIAMKHYIWLRMKLTNSWQ